MADFLLLPPTAAAIAQDGPALEELRFVRDEGANLVWAVEHLTENALGHPWPGHERVVAAGATPLDATPAPATPAGSASRTLGYRLQTPVPGNWFPFLPASIDAARGDIAFERAVQVSTVTGEVVQPAGRLLRPEGSGHDGGAAYRIREEEVPRAGVRVVRRMRRTRWTDGSTHLWLARRRGPGVGAGSSGLRFDLAESAE